MPHVLVVGDIHLKPWIIASAHDILMSHPEIDAAVFLGDYVDDWNRNIDAYIETINALRDFDAQHPDTLYCLGNHDYMYLHGDIRYPSSGFLEHLKYQVRHLLQTFAHDVEARLRIIHVIDDVVFSHGGISIKYVNRIRAKLRDDDVSIDDIIAFTEMASTDFLWTDDSPLWFRPSDIDKAFPDIYQVTGHTPVHHVTQIDKLIICDTFSTYPNHASIGDATFVLYDTDTHTYKTLPSHT